MTPQEMAQLGQQQGPGAPQQPSQTLSGNAPPQQSGPDPALMMAMLNRKARPKKGHQKRAKARGGRKRK